MDKNLSARLTALVSLFVLCACVTEQGREARSDKQHRIYDKIQACQQAGSMIVYTGFGHMRINAEIKRPSDVPGNAHINDYTCRG